MSDLPFLINYKGDKSGDRRQNFHFDWSLNITNILALLVLLWSIISYGNTIVSHLKANDAKVTILWNHFDQNQLNKNELETVQYIK